MATQANAYLVITDGTVTVTLSDGSGGATNYRVLFEQWAPAVARLSQSQLGGRGPYEDVAESVNLVVLGSTFNAALDNVAILRRLLEQAARWARGENVAAVLIKWAPKGSTVATTAAPFQAAILGGAVDLQSKWTSDPQTFQTPVTLTFTRRGAWLLGEVSGVSSSVNNGNVATIAVTATNEFSPARLTITNVGIGYDSPSFYDGGFVALSDVSGAIQMVNGRSCGTSGSVWSVAADSATFSRSGSVARFTPPSVAEAYITDGGSAASALPSNCQRAAVFVNVRNNSASTTFLLRAVSGTGYGPYLSTPQVLLSTSEGPAWKYLGTLPINKNFNDQVLLYALPSAGSGTMDVDAMAVIDISQPGTSIFSLLRVTSNIALDFVHGQVETVTVDPQLLSAPAPFLSSTHFNMGFQGDPVYFSKGGSLAALLMSSGTDSGRGWTQANAGSALANTWTAFRRPAYLVPE